MLARLIRVLILLYLLLSASLQAGETSITVEAELTGKYGTLYYTEQNNGAPVVLFDSELTPAPCILGRWLDFVTRYGDKLLQQDEKGTFADGRK